MQKTNTLPYKFSNSKSKKNNTDCDKRTIIQNIEVGNHFTHTADIGALLKAGTSMKRYAGIGPDSLHIYDEQSGIEQDLPNEVCDGLCEDINYKLRYIINDSLTRARLAGRNYISSKDIENTFEFLNIEPVYGAPTVPSWERLEGHNLFYLEDKEINLVEMAEQEVSFMQPADIVISRQWLPEKENSKHLKNYFTVMCQSLVSKDSDVLKLALQDLTENNHIGPIIDWFYRFAYLLLSYHFSCDFLTLNALSIIEALEMNPVADITVYDKQLNLLSRLILQKLFSSTTTKATLNRTCSILALLCTRRALRELVVAKISQKMDEIKDSHTMQILSIINAFGIDVIKTIFFPNMDYFLEKKKDLDIRLELLCTYNIICREQIEDLGIHKAFEESFDSLAIFWRSPRLVFKGSKMMEINWLTVKSKLLKTRRKMDVSTFNERKTGSPSVLPFDESEDQNSKFIFKFHTVKVPLYRERFLKKDLSPRASSCLKEKHIIVGKISLLINELKGFKRKSRQTSCFDHTLLSYNL